MIFPLQGGDIMGDLYQASEHEVENKGKEKEKKKWTLRLRSKDEKKSKRTSSTRAWARIRFRETDVGTRHSFFKGECSHQPAVWRATR